MADTSDNAEAPPCDGQAAGSAGLLSLVAALQDTWRELAAVRIALIAHDLRAACFAMTAMVGMAVAAACLAAMSWLVLLGLGLHWAVGQGLGWNAAGALLLAGNLLAVALLAIAVRHTGGIVLASTIISLRAADGREGRADE